MLELENKIDAEELYRFLYYLGIRVNNMSTEFLLLFSKKSLLKYHNHIISNVSIELTRFSAGFK